MEPFEGDKADEDTEMAEESSLLTLAQKRKPSVLYCQFNENHSYKTQEERDEHEQVCPDRASYQRKIEKSQ